jgi:hypothetical protein
MKWEVLQQMKCPKCECDLVMDMLEVKCIAGDFKMARGKYIALTGKMPINYEKEATRLLRKHRK